MKRQLLPYLQTDKPLIGTIKGFEHDRYGTQKTVIVELISAILNPYLIDGMRRQNDLVLNQLLGIERSPHGNTFNNFTLVVEKA